MQIGPAIFYDTSYFSNLTVNGIKWDVYGNDLDNIITDGVYKEIIQGANSDHIGIKYILWKNRLKKDFKRIIFDECQKDISAHNIFSERLILLKSSPLYCSTYYTWLKFAIEPFFLLDDHRNLYYNYQFILKSCEDSKEQYYKQMGQFTQEELKYSRDVATLDPDKFINARKKKRKDFRNNSIKLVDYQLCISAFIYSCANGVSSFINTLDFDFVEIVDNLYRSLIDQYAIHEVLKKYLGENIIEEKIIFVPKVELNNEIESILCTINEKENKKNMISVSLNYLDLNTSKIQTSRFWLPIWIAEFFIKHKSIDCYSLDIRSESFEKFRYNVDPTQKLNTLIFKIIPKKVPFYDGVLFNCEGICKYCKEEKDPSTITTFTDQKIILNEDDAH